MFITFEGTEGSGKSSQIDALANFLRGKGFNVLTTREPGGTDISEQVRAVLSNLDNKQVHPHTGDAALPGGARPAVQSTGPVLRVRAAAEEHGQQCPH